MKLVKGTFVHSWGQDCWFHSVNYTWADISFNLWIPLTQRSRLMVISRVLTLFRQEGMTNQVTPTLPSPQGHSVELRLFPGVRCKMREIQLSADSWGQEKVWTCYFYRLWRAGLGEQSGPGLQRLTSPLLIMNRPHFKPGPCNQQ